MALSQKGHKKEMFWSLRSYFRRSILCLFLSVIFLWFVPCSRAQNQKEIIPVQLTAHERNWLSEHKVIRIAPDPYFPPIDWIDNKSNYRGISADFIQAVQKKTGINFKVIKCKNWDEVLEKQTIIKFQPARIHRILLSHPYRYRCRRLYPRLGCVKQ